MYILFYKKYYKFNNFKEKMTKNYVLHISKSSKSYFMYFSVSLESKRISKRILCNESSYVFTLSIILMF